MLDILCYLAGSLIATFLVCQVFLLVEECCERRKAKR